MRVLLLTLLLILPVFAGCMGDDGEAPGAVEGDVAASAAEAGATTGPAPSAPKSPYQVTVDEEDASDSQGGGKGTTATAYPVSIETNPARPPITLDLSGEFDPVACGTGLSVNLPIPGGPRTWQWNDLRDELSVGDAYSYRIEMKYANTDQNWADLHLYYGLDGHNEFYSEPNAEKRGEIVMNFTGQSYRVNEDDMAWVAASCWYGFFTEPIPYTLTVTLTFVESALPAGAPVLLTVPPEATRLFVTGLAVDPSKGVLSHYRVFGPDDELLCECALSSNQQAASFELPGPGDYVLLVDHTDNGFVSFALDAPTNASLLPLQLEWQRHVVLTNDGGPIDETVEIDVPTTPLILNTWVSPPGSEDAANNVGTGKGYGITVTNSRGEVVRQKLAGFATYRVVVPGAFWIQNWYAVPFPDAEWEFMNDHHAYGNGPHQVHVKADNFRGEAVMSVLTYVRP